MSSGLSVKLNRKINVKDLILDCNLIMKDILCVSEIPRLVVSIFENGKKKLLEKGEIGNDGEYLLVQLEGIDDGISISFTEIKLQLPYITEDESGIWSSITVGIKKSHIEFALAASIAIKIAKTQNTNIQDDGCIWNKKLRINPNEFLKSIAVNKKSISIEEAAEIMFKSLNFNKRVK